MAKAQRTSAFQSKFTQNLFFSSSEGNFTLDLTEGQWPDDIDGAAYIIAPDKSEPGGHWLAHHGIVFRIDCKSQNGKVNVLAKRVNTPANRFRQLLPKLFGTMSALEISPLGITNLANTNLQALDGRMFVGYDIGRPIEIDPKTLDYLSPVGSNDSWLQGVPAFVEPQISVAAHPAPDYEKNELYFINYNLVPNNQGVKEMTIAWWDLRGKIHRWPINTDAVFDTIHDIKATRNYVIVTDLPLIVEPRTVYGKPRRHANQDIGQMWIIAKDDLRNTKPGEPVNAKYLKLPSPAGHIKVDTNDDGDRLTIYLQQVPATDLSLVISEYEKNINGDAFPAELEGFISVGPQPSATGKYTIDANKGEIIDYKLAWSKDKHWSSLLWTENNFSPEVREKSRFLWMTCLGYSPELTFKSAYKLYKDSPSALVSFDTLPDEAIPPSIYRLNLDTMSYEDEFTFDEGTFAHPPTFIPRINSQSEDDGYVLAFLNKDGPKEIILFDAANLSKGPIARASGDGFNPPVTLHSTWTNQQYRNVNYRVSLFRDIVGAIISMPKTTFSFFKHAKNMNKRFEVR